MFGHFEPAPDRGADGEHGISCAVWDESDPQPGQEPDCDCGAYLSDPDAWRDNCAADHRWSA